MSGQIAYGQAVSVTTTDPRHETQDQASVAVLFTGLVGGTTSNGQWEVQINNIPVTVIGATRNVPSANYVTVSFDATGLNGVPYLLPTQVLTVRFTNVGSTLTVGGVTALSQVAFATSKNTWTGDCSDLAFFQQGLIPTKVAKVCVPVVEDFTQYQFYLSLRVRNSDAYAGGNVLHNISWGDGNNTSEASYQSDAAGAASTTFIDPTALSGLPAIIVTSRPTHTYPNSTTGPAPNACGWTASVTPALNFAAGVLCPGLTKTTLFANYDTDNKNTGTLNLPPLPNANSNLVCRGTNVNMNFTDNTNINCPLAFEARVPNQARRAIRITYGSRDNGGVGNIPDIFVTLPSAIFGVIPPIRVTNNNATGTRVSPTGYFPTNTGPADGNGVIVINAPVLTSTAATYMATITTTDPTLQVVTQRLYVKLEYWDVCNAYNALVPATLALAESVENFVEIVTTPPAPTFTPTPPNFCEGQADGNYNLSAAVAANTTYRWYSTFPLAVAGDLEVTANTFNPVTEASVPGVVNKSPGAPTTRNFFLTGTLVNGCESLPTTVPFTIHKQVVPGVIAHAVPLTLCTGEDPPAFTSTTPASGGDGVLYAYQWQQKNGAGVFTNIGGATGLTYDPGVLTAAMSPVQFQRIASSGVCASQASNIVTFVIEQAVTAGTIGNSQTVCTGANPAAFTNTLSPTLGSGLYAYQWQSSTAGPAGPYFAITGATSITYDEPGPITTTTYYQRVVTSGVATGACPGFATTAAVSITVDQAVVPGTIGNTQVVCAGVDPAAFTSLTLGSGGNGTPPTYQWSSSTVSGGPYNPIAGATNPTYDPPVLAVTTYYVRIATSGVCAPQPTTEVSVTVNALPTVASATGGGSVCSGNPAPDIVFNLTGTGPFTLTYTINGATIPASINIVEPTNVFTIVGPTTAGTYKISALSDSNSPVCAATAISPSRTVASGGSAPTFATGPTLDISAACNAGSPGTTDPKLVFTLDAGSASTAGFILTYRVDGVLRPTKTFTTTATSAPTVATQPTFSEVTLDAVGPHTIQLVSIQSAAGCQTLDNTSLAFTVRPVPVMANQAKTICSGAAVNREILLTPANTPAGTTFSWPLPTMSAGGAQGSIGTAVAADPATTLHITDVLTNTTGANITATYVVTPTSSLGCVGTPRNITITIRPQPVVAAGQVKTICSGQTTNYEVLLSPLNAPAGSTLTWPAPVVSAGPAQGAAGTILADPAGTKHINQTLTNLTGAPITVTYTVTPSSAFACAGAPVDIVFTVNPAPVITAGQVKTICSGDPVNLEVLMTPANTPAGTRFSWPVPTVSAGPIQGNLGAAVAADPAGTLHLTDVLTNVTGNNITVTYNITPTSNAPASCAGALTPVVITVRPAPNLVSGQVVTICSGQNVNREILLTPANLPAGTTFTWPDPDGAGPANGQLVDLPMGAAGTKHIMDVLTNFTAAPINVTYVITPKSGAGCLGTPRNVVVTVNPLPGTNAVSGPGTVCANATTTLLYQVTPNTGSSYNWVVPAPFVKFAGGTTADFFVLVRFPTVGAGNITMTETNVYLCTGTTQSLPVTVASAPGALAINGPDPVCKNQTGVNYTIPPGAFTPGSTYTWTASGATITSAASGPNLQTITVDFGLSAAATVSVSETSSSGCSGTPFTKNITVGDRPVMTSLNTTTICSGAAPTLPFGASQLSTFSWTVTSITGSVDGVTNGQAGTGNLGVTFTGVAALRNTSGAVGSVAFEVIPTAQASPNCQGPAQTVTVLVNPEPVLVLNQAKTICSGQSVNYEILLDPANLPAGTNFDWTAPVMSAGAAQGTAQSGVPMGPAGTKHILDVLTNTSGSTITATYTIVARSGAACLSNQTAAQRRIVITVNPEPVMAAVSDIIVCPGLAVGPISFSANTLGGETFSWTNDNPSIGLLASGTGNIAAYTAPLNASGSNMVGNMSVTATKNGCVSAPVTFKITIRPQPVVSPIIDITVCPGQTIGPINFVANSGGSEAFNWTNTNPAVGVGLSGLGSIPSYIAPANLTGAAFVGDFSVTATKNGCTSTAVTFKVTVKPEPVISAISSISVCPGQTIGPVNFTANTGGGEVFTWTNDNTTVGLSSGSTGNIGSFVAPANTTGSPFIANVSVTTNKNGCNSLPENFQIIVKPQPIMSPVTDITVCPGVSVTAINFVANTGGSETFNWTNDNPAVGVLGSGTGSIASYTAPPNVSGVNIVGNFSVTATLNGCVSPPITFKITIKPQPVVNTVTSVTVCPGVSVGPFTFSANTGGSEVFSWTNDNTLIGLAGSGPGNIGAFNTLSNTTGANIVGNISVSALKNGCTSAPFVFQVIVKPQPVVTPITDIEACPGQGVGPITFTANTGGLETFNWTNDNTTIGLGGSGTGSIPSFIAPANATGSNFVGNISVTATKNGCVSTIATFKITIKPRPVVTAVPDITKCPGQNVGPVNFVANTGGSETFNWTNDNTAIGILASGVGPISSYVAPANLTGAPIVGNISVTAVKNGCTSPPVTFQITISPQPVMNAVLNIADCPGQTVGPINFGANTGGGETFAWTNSNTAIGLGLNGTGIIPSYVAPPNISGVNIVGNISVTATLAGCTSTPGAFTITIKPQPVVNTVTDITVCPAGLIAPPAFVANTGGAETFNWTNTNSAIGIGLNGIGNIASYAAPANISGVPIVGTISVTATKNGCTSNAMTFKITISPQPVVNAVTDIVACPGATVGPITFGANTGGGESFSWSNTNTTTGLALNGVGNISSYIAPANLTGAAFTSTVSVTATLNGCPSVIRTFNITINPQPVVAVIPDASVCPTATVGPFNFTANTGGAEVFSWSNSNPSIGLVASGVGNIPSWVAPANLTGTAFVGTISVIATKNSCASVARTFQVTIKPTPVVSSESNIIVCPGDPIGPINFAANTGGSETFNWTNSNGSIGLPTVGVGDITTYVAPANLTGTAIVGNMSVIATKNGCASAPMLFTITIRPQPVVTTVTPISVCPGQTIGPINFGANTGGSETFDWTNSSAAIGLPVFGSGNIAAYAAPANLTGTAFVGNISVTATKNGCTSTAMVFSITVKPEPVVSTVLDISVCPGFTVGPVNFAANTGGSETFNWTNSNPLIGLVAGGSGPISSYAAPPNNTGSDIVGTISVTATKTGCTSVARTFTITIKAVPVITAQPNIDVCTGAGIGPINFVSNTGGGETYSWTNSNTAIGLPATGNGNIASYVSPNNTGNTNFVGTITVTATKGTCVSGTMVFTITVRPKPVVSSSLSKTLCSDQIYGSNISTDGVSVGASNYDITAVVDAGLVGSATTGLARPAAAIFNDVFTNTTAVPKNVTYTITPHGTNGCVGDPKVVVFTINPKPVIFNPGVPAVCSNDISNVVLGTDGISVGASSYRIIAKQYSTDGGFTFGGAIPANFTDAGNAALNTPGTFNLIKNDKYSNTRATTVIVRYTIVPTGPSNPPAPCDGAAVNFDLPVNPQPTLDPGLSPTPVCSGLPTSITLGVQAGSVAAATYNINSIIIPAGVTSGGTNAGIGPGQLSNAIFNDVWINTTSGPLSVQYHIVPVVGTPSFCEGAEAILVFNINPAPAVEDNLNRTVCSNVVGGVVLASKSTSVTATSYDVIGITVMGGLVPNGSNATSPAVAVAANYFAADRFDNPTNNPLTVTYSVRPRSSLGCLGPLKDIVLTIEPTVVATPVNFKANICSSTTLNGIDPVDIEFVSPTNPTAGVITFNYTAVSSIGAQMTGFIPALSNLAEGHHITDNLVNSSDSPGFVTYNITPVANGARGGAGCTGAPVPVIVNVEPKPKLIATPSSRIVCEGDATNIGLSSLTAPSTGVVEYLLQNVVATGGVTGMTLVNTVFPKTSSLNDNLNNPGLNIETVTYTFRPRISGGAGCVGDDVNVVITVNPRPNITASPQAPICSGETVDITLTSDLGPTTVSTWTVVAPIAPNVTGASSGAGDRIFQVLFNNNGTTAETVHYLVTPRVGTCTGPAIPVDVVVNPKPKATVPSTLKVCHGGFLNINPTSNVAGTTYTWTVDDSNGLGVTPSGSGPIINYQLFNTIGFQATLVYTFVPTGPAATNCVGDSKIVIVTVSPEMKAQFLNPNPEYICKNSTEFLIVELTGQPLFSFKYTDGTTVFNVPNKAGTTVISKPNMQTTTRFALISVTDPNGCSIDTLANPASFPQKFVKVFVGDTDPTFAITNPLPAEGCSPVEVSFQYNQVQDTYYRWSFGDAADSLSTGAATSTQLNKIIKHTYVNDNPTSTFNFRASLATYLDTLKYPALGCLKRSANLPVRVYPNIVINVVADQTEICSGEIVRFSSQTIGATSQTWSFRIQGQVPETVIGSGTTLNYAFTNNTLANPIIYEVLFRATNGHCPASNDSSPIEIKVYRSVVADFDEGPAPHEFLNGTADLTYTNTSTPVDPAFYTYDWSFGADATPATFSGPVPPLVSYSTPGTKRVTLDAFNTLRPSCKSVQRVKFINITIKPLVATFIASPSESCFPATIEVTSSTSTGNVLEYKVYLGGDVVATSNVPLPKFLLTRPGIYRIEMSTSNTFTHQIAFATPQEVTVFPKPIAAFTATPTTVFVPDQKLTLHNQSQGANQYYWDFDFNNEFLVQTEPADDPNYSYKIEGIYNLALYAQFDHGNGVVCADTSIQKITAKQGGVTKVPNAFTPNLNGPGGANGPGDKANDVFMPIVKGAEEYNLQIYDRWGNLIFESNSTQTGWDGYNADGKLLPAGVYVYKLTIRLSDGQRTTQIGDVTMIR
ncbi:MAG: T9SS type B sorting domain-containing protein [Cyclobacteriaceae bacterium]|nr:T9SS type B sorting domain-containing protein [Cyclobacteriaceae bacterium]